MQNHRKTTHTAHHAKVRFDVHKCANCATQHGIIVQAIRQPLFENSKRICCVKNVTWLHRAISNVEIQSGLFEYAFLQKLFEWHDWRRLKFTHRQIRGISNQRNCWANIRLGLVRRMVNLCKAFRCSQFWHSIRLVDKLFAQVRANTYLMGNKCKSPRGIRLAAANHSITTKMAANNSGNNSGYQAISAAEHMS